MKSLLKAADMQAQAGVRHLAPRAHQETAAPLLEVAPNLSADALRIAALEERNAALEAELRQAVDAASVLEDSAFERGLGEGAARAASREEDRLAALAAGLADAQKDFSARLAQLDIIALEVAQTALVRLFADDTLYPGMVAATLRCQMADLERNMAIRACISPADFPDEAALAALSALLPGLDLVRDPALTPGDCRIDLRLGRIDAGIDGQWSRLSALIDDMAREVVEA